MEKKIWTLLLTFLIVVMSPLSGSANTATTLTKEAGITFTEAGGGTSQHFAEGTEPGEPDNHLTLPITGDTPVLVSQMSGLLLLIFGLYYVVKGRRTEVSNL